MAWIIERLDRKLTSQGLISYRHRRLVVSCSKMALDGFIGVCLLVEGRGSSVTSRGSRVNGRGSRVTSRGSRVNGRGSKNPPQLFLKFF